MYLLLPCPKQATTNATTNDTHHKKSQEPRVPMPTGSRKVVAGTTESPQETRRHITTEPAISHQQQDDPAKPKQNKRQRRRRAPQLKVCTTVEPQEPTGKEYTTNELDQWLEGLKKEKWWPQDQTTKNTPVTSDAAATVMKDD